MPCLLRCARGRTARTPEPGILRWGAWGEFNETQLNHPTNHRRDKAVGGQPARLNRGFCAGALGEYGMTPTDLLDTLPRGWTVCAPGRGHS